VIPQASIGQLGSRHETRLLRNLVEAHFFETGRHPDRLEEIAPALEQVNPSITPQELAEYYYVVRDDEVILLAPMR
jgi:hypothetical protein